MTDLSKLSASTTKSKRRLGRGYGSQKGGHTSTRGQKGQKSRNSVPIWFEGGQLPLIRRTPFIKGKFRFKSLKPKPFILSLTDLNKFKVNSIVTLDSAIKTLNLPSKQISTQKLKVLATGKLTKVLTVKLPTSKSAAAAIKKAGGRVE